MPGAKAKSKEAELWASRTSMCHGIPLQEAERGAAKGGVSAVVPQRQHDKAFDLYTCAGRGAGGAA